MFTIITTILFFMVFFKLIGFAFRLGWGIMKIAVFLVLFPVLTLGLLLGGLVFLALPIILIAAVAGIATAA